MSYEINENKCEIPILVLDLLIMSRPYKIIRLLIIDMTRYYHGLCNT